MMLVVNNLSIDYDDQIEAFHLGQEAENWPIIMSESS